MAPTASVHQSRPLVIQPIQIQFTIAVTFRFRRFTFLGVQQSAVPQIEAQPVKYANDSLTNVTNGEHKCAGMLWQLDRLPQEERRPNDSPER
jgi:hypothetical protein